MQDPPIDFVLSTLADICSTRAPKRVRMEAAEPAAVPLPPFDQVSVTCLGSTRHITSASLAQNAVRKLAQREFWGPKILMFSAKRSANELLAATMVRGSLSPARCC